MYSYKLVLILSLKKRFSQTMERFSYDFRMAGLQLTLLAMKVIWKWFLDSYKLVLILNLETRSVMMRLSCDFNFEQRGWTPVHFACSEGKMGLVSMILASSVNLEARDDVSRS
jgi:hypothetical protein